MPHDVDFIKMKIIKYITDTVPAKDLKFYNNINGDTLKYIKYKSVRLIPHIYSPRELNFVKNVVLLKFNNGNISKAKNTGTVLRKSQVGPNASNVFSCITTVSLS